MAHFRGTISGDRGEASRLGTKNSGLQTGCDGWNLGATCTIEYNEKKDRDEVSVSITCGSGYGGSEFIGTWYLNERTKKFVKVRR